MDNVTLTFLNALAEMLGMLPQQAQADPTQGQSNRGGITSARTQRQGQRSSSRNRAQRAGRSTAKVTSDAGTRPGAIVRSPGGQLAKTQPPGALATRPSSALTTRMSGPSSAYTPDPFAGSATVPPQQGGGSARGNLLSPGAQPQQYGRIAGPVDSNPMRGLSPASRNAMPQGVGGNAQRIGPLSGLIEIVGSMLTDKFIGKPLAELIYDLAAQQPGTAASKGLVGEDGGIYQSGPLTRFRDPIGPQPTDAGEATRTEIAPSQSGATWQDSMFQGSAAPQPVKPVEPQPVEPAEVASVPTARQLQKQDFDRQYDERRAAALKITDPVERAKALENVTTFGLKLHKEYFAK